MAKILIAFDTENFTSQATCDGLERYLDILEKYNVRGNFNIVARLAEALEKWGCYDLIERLKKHGIFYHTASHSVHPVINELTDIEDFDEACRRIKETQAEGIETVKRVFGRDELYAFVPPGNSVSYAAIYAFADLGLPIGAGTMIDTVKGEGTWFCNEYNIEYHYGCDGAAFSNGDEAYFRRHLDAFAQRDYTLIYCHPDRVYFERYWDEELYMGQNTPEAEWHEPKRKPTERTEKQFANFELLIKLLSEDSRFSFTTHEDVTNELRALPERIVTPADCPRILDRLSQKFCYLSAPSLCLSDVILACRDFLQGKKEHVCGKVYGFLDEPVGVTAPVKVTKEELIASCAQIEDGKMLPSSLLVGENRIGPADWMFAALEVLCGKETAAVLPKPQLFPLDEFPPLQNLSLAHSWLSPDLEDRFLSRRARLQEYTIRH